MKKVLIMIPTLGYGGAERVLVNLVNNMDHTLFDITVLTLFDEGVYRDKLNDRVHYISAFKKQFHGNTTLFSLVPSKWLYHFIVKDEYDFVISYLEGPTTHLLSGCDSKKTKRIAWIHIELNDSFRFRQGFISKREVIKAYKSFDQIVCVAESVKESFVTTADTDFSNIRVLYNTNETEKIKKDATESVTDILFPSDGINVCSVAKLMHTKGFDRLIRVHKRLLDEGINHRVYLVGEGEKRSFLERFISENHLEKTFFLVGFRENPYKYMAAADMYVCSSRREGFSTAVTEALILGKPVVSTCCSGAYELLGENNEYGIVVENSEDGIYEGMKRLLLNKELREHYRQKAAERGKLFSTEHTVKAVEEMLLSL